MGFIGVQPASAPLTASDITDGIVSTAKLGDDAVSLAKMASGTDGQIITYDASGNPSAVGPGTDGQVLTSTGAGSPPAFEDAGGGAFTHINTISITSSTADATFLHGTNSVVLNDGTYENFLIIGSGIQLSNDDDQVRVSFSIDTGSNYNAQTYRATDQVEMTQSGSSASASQSAQSSSGATELGGAVGNNTGNTFMFTMFLFNLNSTTMKKTALVEALEEQHNLIYKKRSSFITVAESNAAVDGIRFNCNAGTFSKATFRLYGISNG